MTKAPKDKAVGTTIDWITAAAAAETDARDPAAGIATDPASRATASAAADPPLLPLLPLPLPILTSLRIPWRAIVLLTPVVPSCCRRQPVPARRPSSLNGYCGFFPRWTNPKKFSRLHSRARPPPK